VNAFVLVHGGHQGSWFWERVVPLLDRPALAVDLPGRGRHPAALDTVGVAESVASVLGDIEEAGFDRVILAGNSIASATMPGVAGQLGDRVDGLVFFGTPIALEGQTIMECFPQEVKDLAAQRLRTEGGTTTTSDADRRAMNCNDMDEEQTRFALERAVPDSRRFFSEPISWKGIPRDVPLTYARLMLDQALVTRVQDHKIANLRQLGERVEVVDVEAGHCPMISNPAAIAAVLNRR
jgi:pimeloyl-ACP methyl ester carboxylesterase